MENTMHSEADLFEQLGLPASEKDIQAFISSYRPLPDNIKLHEAPFWTNAQAKFLRDQIAIDADWAVPIDTLDARLRK